MGMTAARDLKPGQSAFDQDFPLRARIVYSVNPVPDEEGLRDEAGNPVPTVLVRWGHPDQPEPERLARGDTGMVRADKEYDVLDR
jgi:hypothetical protein